MGQPHLTPPLLEGSRASVGGIRKVGLHWGGPSRPPDRLYPGATKDHRDYVWARTQNVQTQRLCKPEVILSAPQTREFGALLNALNGGSYIYGGPGDDNTGFMAHVARDFIGHQRGELAQQAAKAVGAGVFAAHQGELVLHQGVIDDVDVAHGEGQKKGSKKKGAQSARKRA